MTEAEWHAAPAWQLSWYDLEDHVVSSDCDTVAALVGRRAADRLDVLSAFPYPSQGWRLISGERPVPDKGELSVLAAPWPAAGPTRWALISVSYNDGEVHLASESPTPLRLGRARRRWGLELQWRNPIIEHRQGSRFSAQAVLQNVQPIDWFGDGRDFDYVRASVTPAVGQQLPARRWGSGGATVERLPILGVSECVALDVRLLWNADAEELAPGEYRLDAELYDLGLRSPPATLLVTAG